MRGIHIGVCAVAQLIEILDAETVDAAKHVGEPACGSTPLSLAVWIKV
jgi:hypothetical protein